MINTTDITNVFFTVIFICRKTYNETSGYSRRNYTKRGQSNHQIKKKKTKFVTTIV